jgi:hypothetical protein
MSVKNIYEIIPQGLLRKADNPNMHIHGIKLPARICVSAPSGSGKTNMVINFISMCSQGKGTFSTIQIVTRDADEPLYNYLKLKNDQIRITEGLHTLPELKKFDKEENHLVIIDDLCLAKDQSSVLEYYIRCRKQNVTVMYLTQSYFKIPIIIRQNCNYAVILGVGNKRSMNLMLSEFAIGASKEQLMGMYKESTREKLHFLLIDVDESCAQKKFRKDFNEWLDPADFGVDR